MDNQGTPKVQTWIFHQDLCLINTWVAIRAHVRHLFTKIRLWTDLLLSYKLESRLRSHSAHGFSQSSLHSAGFVEYWVASFKEGAAIILGFFAGSSDNMDLTGTKIVVMVLTSVIPILLSLLPLWFKSYLVPSRNHQSKWRAIIQSVLLCFGGGVLLATSLVHLLPEVSSLYSNVINDKQAFSSDSWDSWASRGGDWISGRNSSVLWLFHDLFCLGSCVHDPRRSCS